MRTKATNFLQGVILITGIAYIGITIIFIFSPVGEDWLKEIHSDPFISTIYNMATGFAALLFSLGLSMILPLFDPLRYRGLIYYTGVLFPLTASIIFLKNGISTMNDTIIIFGSILILILLLTVIALLITRKTVKSGVE